MTLRLGSRCNLVDPNALYNISVNPSEVHETIVLQPLPS